MADVEAATSSPSGEGTHAVEEGHVRVLRTSFANAVPTQRRASRQVREYPLEPRHQLRWSPSPEGEDAR